VEKATVAVSSQPFSTPAPEGSRIDSKGTRTGLTRKCKTDLMSVAPTTEVFAIAYSSEMGLLAVCSGKQGDNENINVGLYEAKDMTLIQMLPPLVAYPKKRKSKVERDWIKHLTLNFAKDLVSVGIDYFTSLEKDLFIIQLL